MEQILSTENLVANFGLPHGTIWLVDVSLFDWAMSHIQHPIMCYVIIHSMLSNIPCILLNQCHLISSAMSSLSMSSAMSSVKSWQCQVSCPGGMMNAYSIHPMGPRYWFWKVLSQNWRMKLIPQEPLPIFMFLKVHPLLWSWNYFLILWLYP